MIYQQPEALRLAEKTAGLIHTLRRTPMPLADLIPHLQAQSDELRRLHEECNEQARLLGMSAERELRLRAINEQLLEALEHAVLWGEGGRDEPSWVLDARAAIQAAKGAA